MKINFYRIIGFIIGLILIYFLIMIFSDEESKEILDEKNNSLEIDFQKYNYQFAEGSVLSVLEGLIGDKRAVLYLPDTGYINVSSGDSFGIVFAIQNVLNAGENYFEYSFTPAAFTLVDCGVSEEEAKSWITSGQKSFGKITGDWVDKMSVYFEFPQDVKCKATYDFKVIKDGEEYYEDKLEFNII